MTKKINNNFDYNEEVKKCKTIDDVMDTNELIQRLVKDVLENILEVEMKEKVRFIKIVISETDIVKRTYEVPSVTWI